jgi:ATP-dependent RNA helicase SUPV3L1/SUV3
LWALKHGGLDMPGLAELSHLAASGRTSVALDPAIERSLYRVIGYRIAGNRAVRIDILERLADLIRPLIAWRPTADAATPPPGAAAGNGFSVTVAMTSLLGCSGDDFASVLRSLGYRVERVPAPPPAEDTPPAPEPASAALAAGAEPVPNTAGVADAPLPFPSNDNVPPADSTATPGFAEVEPQAAAEPAAETPPTPAEPAEPAFLEIWRPGRPNRHERPHHEGRERRHARRPAKTTPPADTVTTAETAAETKADRPKRDRPPRRHQRHQRDGQNHERPRPERRREPGDKPPVEARRPPERREKPVDPDSPFAALAALKAQLEAKERG